MKFGLIYDFRNPARWERPWNRWYDELVEHIAWIDSDTSIDSVSVAEHHFADDAGGLPSLNVILGALVARTKRLTLGSCILQFPLHHPLRVAEDALVLDALSGGRYRLGIANGYREVEYQALGLPFSQRGSRAEEGIEILRLAFAGEPFSFSGKHWQIPEILVTPPPIRAGGPEIWLGGVADAAVDRAARLADGFFATDLLVAQSYLDACAKHHLPESRRQVCRIPWLMASEDPERTIAQEGQHLMYLINDYMKLGFLGDMAPYTAPQQIVDDGLWLVLDADAAVAEFSSMKQAGANEVQYLSVMPGEPLDRVAERIEFLSSRVIPRVRAATQTLS